MRYLFLIALFVSFSASAQTYSLELQKVGLPELATAIFKGVVQKDFVIAPDVLADDRKLTLSFKDKEPFQVLNALKNTLEVSGLKLTEKQGVYYVEKSDTTDKSGGIKTALGESLPGGSQSVAGSADSIDTHGDSHEKANADFKTYRVKHRSPEYLANFIKFAGAKVTESPKGEYLIYAADEAIQPKIDRLLDLLDTSPQALTIKAAVIEYNESSDSSRSFSGAFNLLAGKLSMVYKAGQALANTISFKNANIQAALSAIEGDTRFNYLAQPVLRVLDNEKAKITVGADVPVRGQSTLDKNGNPVQSTEYRTSGLVFELLPKINGDSIVLSVDQQISSFVTTTTSNIDSPTLLKRQAQTVIDIQRGELIMMAGLEEQKSSNSTSGFSWLPKFLRSDSSSSNKSQILLLIEVSPS